METGDIDDHVVSNNGDSEKVLATVVASVYAFANEHPDAWVYATGSTKARTRLYRMGITKYLDEVSENFKIYGLRENEWEAFERDIEYDAFLTKYKRL